MSEGASGKSSFDFWCVEKQLVRGAMRSLRVMRLKLVKQVRGLSIFQDLESDGSYFKFDSLMNWKPVKFYKGGSDMVRGVTISLPPEGVFKHSSVQHPVQKENGKGTGQELDANNLPNGIILKMMMS